MVINKNKIYILVLFALFSGIGAQGQKTGLSPYSRYGIGDIQPASLSNSTGMGGLSTPLGFAASVNPSNPATYSSIEKPAFEFGATARFLELSTQDSTQTENTAYLRHFAMGFPVSDRWGLTFGLLPFSSVGYSLLDEETVRNNTTAEQYYTGEGGLRRVFLGNGVDLINKNDSTILAVGLNASYLFGKIDNERKTIFPNGDYFNTKITEKRNYSDFHFEGGLHFNTFIGEENEHKLMAGATYSFAANLNTERTLLVNSFEVGGATDQESPIDTAVYKDGQEGVTQLPFSIKGGFAWEYDEKLLLGIEGEYSPWSQHQVNFDGNNVSDPMEDLTALGLGLQYTPKQQLDASSNIFHLISYRLGGRYTNTPLLIQGEQLRKIGMSFGIGIPLPRSSSASRIDIAAEFGRRGTTNNELVQERYINLEIALSLSPHKANRWFYQKKYN